METRRGDTQLIGPDGSLERPIADEHAATVDARGAAATGAIAGLLERVRRGDRDAAAELIRQYEPVIRRRIRGRLGAEMRRVVDSMDIVSTVARRLDRCVREGRVEASNDAQLWCLLRQITDNAFKEKGRAFQRMRRFEKNLAASTRETSEAEIAGTDSESARMAVGLLSRPEEMELALLRSAGVSFSRIAQVMGISIVAARQRWRYLRRRVTSALQTKAGTT